MNNFKKNNRFGGGSFKRGDRSEDRGFGGSFGGNKEMFKTTCADCGNQCEVPFKPNGRKPVYCKDCFAKNGGQVSTGDFQKKSYAPSRDSRDSRDSRPSYNSNSSSGSSSPVSRPQNDDRKFEELTRQLVNLNSKFDKLVTIAETHFSKIEVKAVEKPVKKESKKASTKKSKE